MKTLTIYIIDDHPIVRKGLKQFINEFEQYDVVGCTGDEDEGVKEIARLKPDIVIIDLTLKKQEAFQIIEHIKKNCYARHILVNTMHDELAYVERAFRAGANGYLTKSEPVDNVHIAISKIIKGEKYIEEGLKNKLVDKYLDGTFDDKHDPLDKLTNREFEVFKKIGEGYGMDEIAEELQLSIKTVQNYRERIKEKLNIQKSRDLIHYAIEWKMSCIKDT